MVQGHDIYEIALNQYLEGLCDGRVRHTSAYDSTISTHWEEC